MRAKVAAVIAVPALTGVMAIALADVALRDIEAEIGSGRWTWCRT